MSSALPEIGIVAAIQPLFSHPLEAMRDIVAPVMSPTVPDEQTVVYPAASILLVVQTHIPDELVRSRDEAALVAVHWAQEAGLPALVDRITRHLQKFPELAALRWFVRHESFKIDRLFDRPGCTAARLRLRMSAASSMTPREAAEREMYDLGDIRLDPRIALAALHALEMGRK